MANKSLKADVHKDIETFIALQKEIQKIDAEFPLQYAICLAEIALCPDISLTELAYKTSMPLSTVSRIVGALSKNRQRGKPYGLIKVTISPTERRRKQINLTASGIKLMTKISAILNT